MLTAISPIDGRYADKTSDFSEYFSEYALIKYRIFVEVEYFIALINFKIPQLCDIPKNAIFEIRGIYHQFNLADAEAIKRIEKTTNHDVKAVEYFLKEKFESLGLGKWKELIHFGLTSQDINNTAIPYSLRLALERVYYPQIVTLINEIEKMSQSWKNIPFLARTHGQPASPTMLGKEFLVFVERLKKQLFTLQNISIEAKFGGATGNFNAHHITYPNFDWKIFSDDFVTTVLGLTRQQTTTQIEHYDNLAALFDAVKRINIILIDFCRDVWTYVMLDCFKQKTVAGEIGSSAMPHKVNPIDFENAEGNLGIGNAIFSHFSDKLPISRLQRDLTDSTVLRNLGVPFSHTLIALKSIIKGLSKLELNMDKINMDLANNQMVIAEAIQSILRREGIENPYEMLKELTRGKVKVAREDIINFINNLQISDSLKQELIRIEPHNYVGI